MLIDYNNDLEYVLRHFHILCAVSPKIRAAYVRVILLSLNHVSSLSPLTRYT